MTPFNTTKEARSEKTLFVFINSVARSKIVPALSWIQTNQIKSIQVQLTKNLLRLVPKHIEKHSSRPEVDQTTKHLANALPSKNGQ